MKLLKSSFAIAHLPFGKSVGNSIIAQVRNGKEGIPPHSNAGGFNRISTNPQRGVLKETVREITVGSMGW
jgi:hypothetical protein